MDDLTWTDTQARRLKELGMDPENTVFSTPEERNKIFQQIEKKQVQSERIRLTKFLTAKKKTHLAQLTENLTEMLNLQGFARVNTPLIISKSSLSKMTIDENHPLFHQVYWINEKQCLRPMLAPNLYSLMVDFSRLNHRPISFFEIGSCFRKESDGAKHSSEFTMLNLVEMGLPKENRQHRLEELASLVAQTAGLNNFKFEIEDSKVYGTTLDVVAGPDEIEVASGAMGPHPLDEPWGLTDTWVGMGFGLERLLMTSQGNTSIGRWGKSLAYVDGIRLRI